MTITETVLLCHQQAHSKDFYTGISCHTLTPCPHRAGGRPATLMLIMSELIEALEADRHFEEPLFREEIADTIIRLFDFCGAEKIDIEAEIIEKLNKNMLRPTRHNKKY